MRTSLCHSERSEESASPCLEGHEWFAALDRAGRGGRCRAELRRSYEPGAAAPLELRRFGGHLNTQGQYAPGTRRESTHDAETTTHARRA